MHPKYSSMISSTCVASYKWQFFSSSKWDLKPGYAFLCNLLNYVHQDGWVLQWPTLWFSRTWHSLQTSISLLVHKEKQLALSLGDYTSVFVSPFSCASSYTIKKMGDNLTTRNKKTFKRYTPWFPSSINAETGSCFLFSVEEGRRNKISN